MILQLITVGQLRCQCCAARLTDPLSLDRGYGPTCWKRLPTEVRDRIEDRLMHRAHEAVRQLALGERI